MSNKQNINDYDTIDLLELFNLSSDFTEAQLSSQFISFLTEHKNINDTQMNFLKEAYLKLKDEINNSNSETSYDENENLYDEHENLSNINLVAPYNPTNSKIQNIHQTDINYSNINPLERTTITKLVNIDSIFRTNPNFVKSNDFVYQFKEDLKNVVSYKISSIEIPVIWNTFSSNLRNNEFTITVNNYSSGNRDPSNNNLSTNLIYIESTTHLITIPNGNYGASEIIDVINNIFINTKQGLDFLLFTIDSGTGKCVFRAKNENDTEYSGYPQPFYNDATTNKYFSPNFNFNINFDLTEYQEIRRQQNQLYETYGDCVQTLSGELLTIYNTKLPSILHNCGYLFGFQKSEYFVYSDNIKTDIYSEKKTINYKCFLESEGYYGDTINKYIFLKVDDFNKNVNNSISSTTTNSMITDNIMAKIPISTGTFSMLMSNNSDHIKKERIFFGPVNIKKMHFQLVDRFDRLIDLGFSNYSITFEFSLLYS